MILVTGGTGLLGSELLRRLINSGNKVRAIKRDTSRMNLVESIKDKIEWVNADVLDIPALEEALSGVIQVYHCAAIVSFNPSKRKFMKEVNVAGTENLVNLSIAAGVKKFVHVSSIAALGRAKEEELINEHVKWVDNDNNSFYSYTKYLSEKEVFRGIEEGLDAVIVNPAVILGPGNWKTDSSSFFSLIWKGMPFYPPGSNGFVDVQDVAESMIILMNSDIKNEQFIISGDNVYYKDIFSMIAEKLEKTPPNLQFGSVLGGIAWRLEALKCFFTKRSPVITKETVRTTCKTYFYDNSKLKASISFNFTPIKDTIDRIGELFLEYKKGRQ